MSFLVSDVGKPGVEKLTAEQSKTVTTIRRYVKSSTLRFALLGSQLIVHQVLNGACNEYYEPGENPEETRFMSGCVGPKRPWVKSDSTIPG